MAAATPIFFLSALLLFITSHAQQQYTNNDMLNCYAKNGSSTLGYNCTAAVTTSCTAYLIFRAETNYTDPVRISYLLNTSATDTTAINNATDSSFFSITTPIIVPVPCSCNRPSAATSTSYYQHDASYRLNYDTETYMLVANNTFQGLSTCQAMMAQNPAFDSRNLKVGQVLKVPLRCACPSQKQAAAGYKYLLSYVVVPGNDVPTIATMFEADVQSIRDANELAVDTIYPYTTLLVPLKSVPTRPQVVAIPAPATPPASPATPSGGSSSNKKWVAVGIGIGAAVLALGGLLTMVMFLRRRRRGGPPASTLPINGRKMPSGDSLSVSADYSALAEKQPPSTTSLLSDEARNLIGSLAVYKYETLQRATGSFDEAHKIKGSVYRATLNGDVAAVKRLKGDVLNEINFLKKFNHTNLVRLSGFCLHQGNTYLVYEFAEKGSLADWVHHHGERKGGADNCLSWKQRVQIAYDVADGLTYLHNYTTPPCIHKDLKSSNILLDAEFRAKLTNFGLARAIIEEDGGAPQQTKHVIGTQGYMSPEYLEHGIITTKVDVFAFGVVLLELLSGKEAIYTMDNGQGGGVLLSGTVEEVVTGEDAREKMKNFMDCCLGKDYPIDSAFAMAQLARRCVAPDPGSRPVMAEVFVALSAIHSAAVDWDPSEDGDQDSVVHGR